MYCTQAWIDIKQWLSIASGSTRHYTPSSNQLRQYLFLFQVHLRTSLQFHTIVLAQPVVVQFTSGLIPVTNKTHHSGKGNKPSSTRNKKLKFEKSNNQHHHHPHEFINHHHPISSSSPSSPLPLYHRPTHPSPPHIPPPFHPLRVQIMNKAMHKSQQKAQQQPKKTTAKVQKKQTKRVHTKTARKMSMFPDWGIVGYPGKGVVGVSAPNGALLGRNWGVS